MPYSWPRRQISPLRSGSDSDTERAHKSNPEVKRWTGPKRVSELSPLKSDSEDEDNMLNCARMANFDFMNSMIGDDYVESPEEFTPQKQQGDDNKENCDIANVKPQPVNGVDDSISSKFKKLSFVTDTQHSPPPPPAKSNPPALQPQYRQIVPSNNARLIAFADRQDDIKRSISIFKNIKSPDELSASKPLSTSSAAIPMPVIKPISKPLDAGPPVKREPSTSISSALITIPTIKPKIKTVQLPPPANDNLQTPNNHTPFDFATPSIDSTAALWQLPSARVPQPDSRLRAKSKSEIRNEFQTKKILFTTPNTGQRPQTMPSRNFNVSIDSSLEDSLYKPMGGTKPPATIEESNARKSIEKMFASDCSVANAKEKNDNRKRLVINGKHFAINKQIGSGGSSVVYLAEAENDRLECAIKVVDLHGDPASVEGYINETKKLAKLQGSACVIRLFEYALLPHEKTMYMVMERGESDLQRVLQTFQSHLPCYTLLTYFHQMLMCVQYIHQNGIIHSDLKPANFLFVNGRLKLIDFGIASNIASDSTSIIKFSQAGTCNYISPESLIDTSTGNSPSRNRPKIKISTKSDVWSLGCILYLLLYRRTPFAHIKSVFAKIHAITNPNTSIEYPLLPSFYPPILLELLQKCLVYDVKSRASVNDLLAFPFHMLIPNTDANGSA